MREMRDEEISTSIYEIEDETSRCDARWMDDRPIRWMVVVDIYLIYLEFFDVKNGLLSVSNHTYMLLCTSIVAPV